MIEFFMSDGSHQTNIFNRCKNSIDVGGAMICRNNPEHAACFHWSAQVRKVAS